MTVQHEQKIAGDQDDFLSTPFATWLAIEPTDERDMFRMRFNERHIGNPFIRALHGGVVGSMIEASAELGLGNLVQVEGPTELVSSAIDYIRVTKDADLFARVSIVRIGRRLAFVEVRCWQDSEDLPVARGSCTLRILEA
ncbi:MAG: PaaI family thioesterase [Salaquimonas sp.]|nr:PaaI family thioesterase [Salaquimonas sp.]